MTSLKEPRYTQRLYGLARGVYEIDSATEENNTRKTRKKALLALYTQVRAKRA